LGGGRGQFIFRSLTLIRPLRDYIVVRPEPIELSKSIIMENREPFNRGTIVAVGPGKPDKKGKIRPLDVRVGDQIRYGNGSYLDWPIQEFDGVKYQVIQEADVCFVESEQEAA
jgi:chaperonin GroES